MTSDLIWNRIKVEFEIARTRAVLWCPAFLAIGIYLFFTAKVEPSKGMLISVGACVFALFYITYFVGFAWRCAFWCIGVIGLGYLAAGYRTHSVTATVLGWQYYGALEGRVVGIDRSGTNKVRLTLSDVKMGKISQPRTPKLVRISLHAKGDRYEPLPNDVVRVVAFLNKPGGPVEPSGFDFQRYAWFRQLGAVGYARKPVERLRTAPTGDLRTRIFLTRMAISDHIKTSINGQAGGFASAILTGDRSDVKPDALTALRQSNLAHLLAISGLHMGLLSATILALARTMFSFVPYIALRYPTKKWSACLACLAGFSYLILSGSGTATQRAFIMVAMMLGSILMDRPALSLRAVALAAILILTLWPESLLEPGFQMSFAATIALIITFQNLKGTTIIPMGQTVRLKSVNFLISLLISSFVAGAATAPFAAYHFNQVAHYGLFANLVSVPIMGTVVMPMAIIAAMLTPVGLDFIPFWIMGKGIDWILLIAQFTSTLDGAVSKVPKASSVTISAFAMGGFIFASMSTPFRKLAVCLWCFGIVLWANTQRPYILVSDDGRLIGVKDGHHRMLNRAKGNGFIARNWLENDGDIRSQKSAAQIFGKTVTVSREDPKIIYHWDTKMTASDLSRLCIDADLVLVPKWRGEHPDACQVIDQDYFWENGALSIDFKNNEIDIKTARHFHGTRLWNSSNNNRRKKR